MADPLKEKSFAFALKITKLTDHIQKERREFTLSRKVLDSSVNIGLFIEEARQGEDRSDFRQKYSLANKEAFKSNYLIRLLHGGGYISDEQFSSLIFECEELQKMLVSALKSLRRSEV
ncbi:MAG: four helix bundle protein [Acidobacteria bacterium]|nr:four helix bundle protein [Acidobacteriota bacterium]